MFNSCKPQQQKAQDAKQKEGRGGRGGDITNIILEWILRGFSYTHEC
jgi:hypothetical protein